MFDIKLKIFFTVASRLNFSKAAEELHITQPAVTRHIKQIEAHFKQQLFDRKGNSIELTKAGSLLYKHCKVLFVQYDEMQYDMNSLVNRTEGVLRISASTTLAQYILPTALAKFHHKFPSIQISMASQNTERVENAVLKKIVELGFIEGRSKNREIAYTPFLKDEIVLVVSKGNPLFKKETLSLEELKTIPMVLREQGSGTLQVVQDALHKVGLQVEDLSVEMHLGSSESIKTYLKHSHSAAFLSINTILKEIQSGDLFIVDVEKLNIQRYFYYITSQGHHSALSALFINFLEHQYNNML